MEVCDWFQNIRNILILVTKVYSMAAVEEFLGVQTAAFFFEGIAKLEHRWSKCVDVKGDYVEK